MAGDGAFVAGSFEFPTGGGTHTVIDGLLFEPQGCLLFGSNQETEDTVLSGGNPGVFIGLVWRDVDSGLIDYQAQSNTTFGVTWSPVPILMLTSGTTVEYAASSAAFTDNGLTITVSTAAPGTRRIHYLVWGGFDGAEGKNMQAPGNQPDVFDFLNLGYRPMSMLSFAMFASGATRTGSNGGSNYLTVGVANFPGEGDEYDESSEVDAANNNAGAITFRTFTQMGSVGYTQGWGNPLNTHIHPSVHSGLVGTFLTDFDHAHPYPDFTSEGLRMSLWGFPNVASMVWWSTEGHTQSVESPEVGVTVVHQAASYIDGIEACFFFGATGYGSEQQLTPNLGYMLGVLTQDYQAVVAWDAGIGGAPADGTPYFFQSRECCFAESLHGGGVRASSGEIFGDELHLTGVIASASSPAEAQFVQMWEAPIFAPTVHQRRRHVGLIPR